MTDSAKQVGTCRTRRRKVGCEGVGDSKIGAGCIDCRQIRGKQIGAGCIGGCTITRNKVSKGGGAGNAEGATNRCVPCRLLYRKTIWPRDPSGEG